MIVSYDNVIEPGVQLDGSIRLVGDSMVSGSIRGDVVCVGKGAVFFLGAQGSVSGDVTADFAVIAGVVGGKIKAKSLLHKVDGCALGSIACEGQVTAGPDADVIIKSHVLQRSPEIDEAGVIMHAIHEQCKNLYAGRAVVFEDGADDAANRRTFLSRLKINLFNS